MMLRILLMIHLLMEDFNFYSNYSIKLKTPQLILYED